MQYEIKRMELGEVLDQAVKLMKNHFKMLFTISCYLLIPLQLAHQFAIYAIMPQMGRNPTPEEMKQFAAIMAGKAILVLLITLVFVIFYLFIAWPLTNAATLRAVASEYLGRHVTAGQAMKEALKLLLPLIGTTLLSGLIIFLCYVPIGLVTVLSFAVIGPGFLAVAAIVLCAIPCAVASIYFALRYGLAQFTVVIEERAGWEALQRSSALMKGNMGALFVLGFLLAIIGGAAGMAAALIPFQPLQIVVSALVQGALVVFGAAAGVVFYFSCRCKLENFDLTVLASAVAQDDAPTAPGAATPQ